MALGCVRDWYVFTCLSQWTQFFFSEGSQTLEQPDSFSNTCQTNFYLWIYFWSNNSTSLFFVQFYNWSTTYNYYKMLFTVMFSIWLNANNLWRLQRVSGSRAKLNPEWYANVPQVSRKNNMTCQMQWSLTVGSQPSLYLIVQVWVGLRWQKKTLNVINNPESSLFLCSQTAKSPCEMKVCEGLMIHV